VQTPIKRTTVGESRPIQEQEDNVLLMSRLRHDEDVGRNLHPCVALCAYITTRPGSRFLVSFATSLIMQIAYG
jgi:hypothetical protein